MVPAPALGNHSSVCVLLKLVGLSSLFPKRNSEEKKNLQEFGKAFVILEVLFSRMAPVSSAVQGRNWTHPRGSCPLPTLPQQCQGSLRLHPFPSPRAPVGSSLSPVPQGFHLEISCSSRREGGIPAQLGGLLESSWGVAQLTLPRQVCCQSVGAAAIEYLQGVFALVSLPGLQDVQPDLVHGAPSSGPVTALQLFLPEGASDGISVVLSRAEKSLFSSGSHDSFHGERKSHGAVL